ncbi:MAG TPA: hypothetical protein PK184_02395 [Phycisphaerae bacterium]|jgi:hypothetical protein|nr:hypothetical protein [Phycisphaerae bacterium]
MTPFLYEKPFICRFWVGGLPQSGGLRRLFLPYPVIIGPAGQIATGAGPILPRETSREQPVWAHNNSMLLDLAAG